MNQSNFSPPYIYSGLYDDELKRETFFFRVEQSFEAREREKSALQKSFKVGIIAMNNQLVSLECHVCREHLRLTELCEHTQGKLTAICEAYGVYYD